jgi:hypothetical protein
MSSWRYGSPTDPYAELDYDLRADLRLRMAFLARRLSDHSGSYVRLAGDDIGPGHDFLHGLRDMAKLLKQLEIETVMYFRAGEGTWEQVGQALDIEPGTAEHRYAEDWVDRQVSHIAVDDRQPLDSRTRHLLRELGDLDAWCQRRYPEDGPQQVTDGLIWPDEPAQPVRTRVQADEDQIRAQRDAERRRSVDAFVANRTRRVEAALKRLAKKPGLARFSLWGNDGTAMTEYIVARDGNYLGRVRRTFLPAPSRAVCWAVEDGPEGADKDIRHPSLDDAAAYLDRVSTRTTAAAPGD